MYLCYTMDMQTPHAIKMRPSFEINSLKQYNYGKIRRFGKKSRSNT